MNGYLRNLAKRTLRTTPPLHPQSRLPFSGASGFEPEVPLEEPAEGRAGEGPAGGEGLEAGPRPGPMGAHGDPEIRPSIGFPEPGDGVPPEERGTRERDGGMEGGPTAEPFPGGSVVPERGRPLGDPMGDLLVEGRFLENPVRNLVKEGRPLRTKRTGKGTAVPSPGEEIPFPPLSARGRAWEDPGDALEFQPPEGRASSEVQPMEERRFTPLLGERPDLKPVSPLPGFPEVPAAGRGFSAGVPEGPDIHVSIGRIEVSAVTSAPSPKKTPPTGPGVMSLKDYEEKRWGRSR